METLPYSQQHSIGKNKPTGITKRDKSKPCAHHSTTPKSFEMDSPLSSNRNSSKSDKEAVFQRTSTNTSFGGSIKKRVQIQEISV